MVEPSAAGVAFSLNPSDGDRSQVAIDSSYGFGESVVSGLVTPDHFLVDKVILEIHSRTISPKHTELVLSENGDGVVWRDVEEDRRRAPSVTDAQLVAIARMAKAAESHYGVPQDIEWAVDRHLSEGENLVLLQSRPETVWSRKARRAVAKPGSGIMDGIVETLLFPVHSRGKAATSTEGGQGREGMRKQN
jgi:pyruvate,water dikinase